MWGVQEPLHPPLAPGSCALDLPLVCPWFTYTVPPVHVCLPSPFPAPGSHSSALLLAGLLVHMPRLRSHLPQFAYSRLLQSLGSCTLTLLVPSPPVHVCQPSRRPPGSRALSALCLCLLVSATWSRSLGICSRSFSFFLGLFGLVWVRLSSFILWWVYFQAP
jgi:hypothetical protein